MGLAEASDVRTPEDTLARRELCVVADRARDRPDRLEHDERLIDLDGVIAA